MSTTVIPNLPTLTDVELDAIARSGSDFAAAAAYALSLRSQIARLVTTSDGAYRILSERLGQVEREGYTAAHDDAHANAELPRAAICYLMHAVGPTLACCTTVNREFSTAAIAVGRSDVVQWDPWPFDAAADKRKFHPPGRQLEIAGALIAAELDRRARLGSEHGVGIAAVKPAATPVAIARCAECEEILREAEGSNVESLREWYDSGRHVCALGDAE